MSNRLIQYAELLGLTGTISSDDVKSAYRRDMLLWHPDLHFGKNTASMAHVRAQALNEAYECLTELAEDEVVSDIRGQPSHAHAHYRTRHTYQACTFTPGFPDPRVFEVFLKSSNLVSTGYDAERCILYLKFNRGAVYRYFDVPRTIFDEILRADSHGRYANKNICRSFRYERCPQWTGRRTMA